MQLVEGIFNCIFNCIPNRDGNFKQSTAGRRRPEHQNILEKKKEGKVREEENQSFTFRLFFDITHSSTHAHTHFNQFAPLVERLSHYHQHHCAALSTDNSDNDVKSRRELPFISGASFFVFFIFFLDHARTS